MQIIKIGSSWCSGCVIMKPIWEKIEKTRTLNTKYYDFDIHEDELKEKYQIGDKLPIIIFLDKESKELERVVGEIQYERLLSLIDKYEDKE